MVWGEIRTGTGICYPLLEKMVSEIEEQGRYIEIQNVKITQTFSGPDGLTGERCSGLVSEGSLSADK